MFTFMHHFASATQHSVGIKDQNDACSLLSVALNMNFWFITSHVVSFPSFCLSDKTI